MKNIAIVLSLLICTLELSAQTSRTWTGSSSTDWNTAGNWSPSGVPSSSDHIILNTASGNQPVLDANRSITNITVSAGTIDVNGYTLTVTGSTNLTGGNINNGVLTFINTSTNISAMTIGAKVNITATATTITNSTFNKKLFVTQTSGAASYTWTGNTYNDTLDYRYTGSATSAGISFLNSTANGDVYVSTSNLYYISFGSGTISTNKFTLAANKRIKIGSSGWSSSASLYLNNVEFNDTNPFTISLSGPISIGSSSFSTAYGPAFNITAAYAIITNSTFNKKLLLIQTTGGNYICTGNTYNDTLDYRYTGSASNSGISFLNSAANGDVYVSATNQYYLYFGSGTISTNKFTLAANKRIKIGSSGWSSGALISLNNVEFNDTNPFTISLSGPISIGSSSFSTAYGPTFNITAAYAIITNSTFNKKLLLIQTTGGNYICMGNTYNDTLDYRYTGSASNSGISFLNSAANGDVYVSATNQYYLHFGSSTISTNKFTLAANKRIKIGSLGWSSGALISLNNVEFNDTNPFTISLSGPISIGSSSFSTAYGPTFNITAAYAIITNSTFNKKLQYTQTVAQNYAWTGNTYNDTLDYRYNGGPTTTALSFLNSTANGDVYVSTTNQYYLHFGSATISTNKFTLAANKRIKIGSSGWSSAAGLSLNNVEFNDTNLFILNCSGSVGIGTSTFNTTYNLAFTITSLGGNINSATFNKKLLYTQTSGNSYVWTGNIYNDTVDYQYTSAVSNGSISFLNSVANGQFYISATNRYGFAFGSSSISTNKFTLGANKRVIIGTSGLASGTYLYFNNIALGDTAAFTLNTSGPIGLGSASFSNSFTNVFTLTSTNPTITNTTFNKKLTVTKTAGGDVNWTGNTFNDTLDYRFTFSGGATVGFLNSTANANVYLSNTGTGYLAFGSSTTSTNKFTLAANKRIFVGPAGWTSTGTLALQNIQFNDSANFAISLSNTAAIILGNYTFNTTYNLPISITNGQISLTKGIFNKKVILTKTATAASLSYGGNTFNDTLDIRLQTGDFTTSNSLPDAYNGHIYFSNSSTGTLNIGRWLGVSSSQAISKKIYIGSAGFATGNLTFNGFTQLDTTLQSLTITGTGSLVINYSTWHSKLTIDAHLVSITQSVFNRKTAVTANSIYNISTSTFNKPFKLIKNSTTNNDWSAGNTFNDTTEFIIHGGTILFNRWGSSTHNGDLYVSNTGTGTLALGSGTYSVTFENNKRIFIGSEGFSTGGLSINRLFLHGTTQPLNITLSGTATLALGNLTTDSINVPVKLDAYGISGIGGRFNKKLFVKTAVAGWWGANLITNDTFDLRCTAVDLITLAYAHATFNGPTFFSNSSSGGFRNIYGSTITIGGNGYIAAGPDGFSAGTLALTNITQTNTIPQNIVFTGTANLVVTTGTFNAPITVTSPTMNSISSRFKKKLTRNKTGGSSTAGDAFYNSTVLEDTVILNNQSNGIISFGGWDGGADTLKGDVYLLNATGGGTFNFFGPYTNSNILTLAAGKKIIVDSTTCKGNIYFKRFNQLGTTAQSIILSKSSNIVFHNGGNVFNGSTILLAGNINLGYTTFNSTANITKTGNSTSLPNSSNIYNADASITNLGTGILALGADTYNANATFTKSGSGDINIITSGTVTFKGDVTVNNISSNQLAAGQVALFTGTNNQTLSQSGGSLNFGRVTINKASNNLTLASPLTVGNALTLTSGKIVSTSTNLLTFADNATVSGASNSSYVEGPVAKTGNDIFTFPIGKSGTYRPLGISAPASTATIFTADYIPSVQTAGSSADTSVTNLSTCEHWLLSRSGSSSNVNVTLSWNSTTCNRASALNMRVSGWSGSSWTNHGNGARTGNSTAGTVTSSTNPSAYNVFALSNKTCTATAAITPSGATTFCAGNAVTLTATAGAINYLWSTTATTQAINATTSATYTINLTDTSGCNGIANQVVTVHANPVANAGTDTTFCSFNTVNLGGSPSASSGTPGYSYTWSPADYLDNAFGANPNFNGIIGSQYVLEVSDANGCLDKDTVQVTVNPGVLLNGGGSKTVCAGSGVVIGNDIAILSGIGPYTYSWSPNTHLDDDTIATPLSTPVTSTTYTVEITDANGCQTTKDVNVTVAPLVNAPRKKVNVQSEIVID